MLLVSLNRSFDDAKAQGVYQRINIYEKTRQYWAIAKSRAAEIDYVLGVYHGIVRSVIKVDSYDWTFYDEEKKSVLVKNAVVFMVL